MRPVLFILLLTACGGPNRSSAVEPKSATSRDELASRAFAAIRANDAAAYIALTPRPADFAGLCPKADVFVGRLPELHSFIEEQITACAALIDWSKAEFSEKGFESDPIPVPECPKLTEQGTAHFEVQVGKRQFAVRVHDVAEIGGSFMTVDYPQCEERIILSNENSGARCRDICARDVACMEKSGLGFDLKECAAACTALMEDESGRKTVEKHAACVEAAGQSCEKVRRCH